MQARRRRVATDGTMWTTHTSNYPPITITASPIRRRRTDDDDVDARTMMVHHGNHINNSATASILLRGTHQYRNRAAFASMDLWTNNMQGGYHANTTRVIGRKWVQYGFISIYTKKRKGLQKHARQHNDRMILHLLHHTPLSRLRNNDVCLL